MLFLRLLLPETSSIYNIPASKGNIPLLFYLSSLLISSSLTVHIDPKNNGEWIECVALTNLQLPEEWARKAHIGITASTGQLSDNHDVLSLMTLSDAEISEMHELALATSSKQIFELGSTNMTVEDRLLR